MAINVKRTALTVTWATSAVTAVSATVPNHVDGWLKMTYFKMPSMSANTSGGMNIYDVAGNKLWSSPASCMSAAGTSAIAGQDVPLGAGYIVEVQLNGSPGSAAGASATPLTANLVLYIGRDS